MSHKKNGFKTSVTTAPMVPKPRERQRGEGKPCPLAGCGGDMFVYTTIAPNRSYPSFLGKRIITRHWKCAKCGATEKTATESSR